MEKIENYKIVFYIILGVLYMFFKFRKKKSDESPNSLPKEDEERRSAKPTSNTFGNRQIKSRPLVSKNQVDMPEKQVSTPGNINEVDYDNDLKDEEQQFASPKMNETDKDQHELFVPYSLEADKENEYATMLKNPDSLKKVIVMQEILTPKHF